MYDVPPPSSPFPRVSKRTAVFLRLPDFQCVNPGVRNGPKGRADEFYDFIKSGKRSNFVIDFYLNDNALDAKF